MRGFLFSEFSLIIFCLRVWAENGPGRAREVFKKVPGGCGFVLAEFEPKRSHGDLVRGQNCGFGTDDW